MKISMKKLSALFLAVLFVLSSIVPTTVFKTVEAAAGDAAYAAVWPQTGAEYTVYSTRSAAETARNNVKAGKAAGTAGMQKTYSGGNGIFTIAANGQSQELEFDVGTYYVVETKVPAGWNQDETVHTMTIVPDGTATNSGNGLVTSVETPDYFKFSPTKDVSMETSVDTKEQYMAKYPITGAKFALFENQADANAVKANIDALGNKTNYPKTVTYNNVAKDMQGNDAIFSIKADGTSDFRWLDEDKTYYMVEVERPTGYLFTNEIITISGSGNTSVNKKATEKPGTAYINVSKAWASDSWVQEFNPDNYNLEITWTIYKADGKTVVASGLTDKETGKMIWDKTYTDGTTPAVQVQLGNYVVEETAVGQNSGLVYAKQTTNVKLEDGDINTLTKVEFKNSPGNDPGDIPLITKKIDENKDTGIYNYTIQGTQFTVYYFKDPELTLADLTEKSVDADGKEITVVKDSVKESAAKKWVFEFKEPDSSYLADLGNGTKQQRAINQIFLTNDNIIEGGDFFSVNGSEGFIVGTYLFEETYATEGLAKVPPYVYNERNNGNNSTPVADYYWQYQTSTASADVPEPPQTIVVKLEKSSNNSDKENYYGSLEGAEFKVEFFNPLNGKWQKATATDFATNDTSEEYIIRTNKDGIAETYPMLPGKYRITEIKAPVGHTLNHVEEDGVTVSGKSVEFTLEEYLNSVENNGQANFTFVYDSMYAKPLENSTTVNILDKVGYDENTKLENVAGATVQLWELGADGKPATQLPLYGEMNYVTTTDSIKLYGLTAGKTYRFIEVAPPEGYLMPQGEEQYVDFTVADDDGEHVFELLNEKIPKLRSKALMSTGIKEALEGEDAVLEDHFWVWDVLPDRNYTFKNIQLRDATTEEVVATAEDVSFTTDSVKHEYDVVFRFNTTGLSGGKYVVTGELHRDGRPVVTNVAIHYDTTDFDESIVVPEIGTYAFDNSKEENSEFDKFILNEGKGTIKDRIDYKQLINGEKYIAETKLVDDAGNFVTKDGKEVVSRVEIIAEGEGNAVDGSVYVTTEVDAKENQGKTLTVYEYIYKVNPDGEEILIAKHEDPNDVKQQVKIPEIKTTASEVVVTNEENQEDYWFEVTDIVEYNHMPYDKDVIGTATVMDPTTGEPLVDEEGNTFTAETEFNTGGSGEGYYTVTINVPYKLVEGKDIVMFETVQNKDKNLDIAYHHDWEDKDQLVEFPEIKTTAWFVNENGEEEVLTKNNLKDVLTAKVKDNVKLSNLEVGADYEVSAELYTVNKDGELSFIVATDPVSYHAEATDGEVVVDFGEVAFPETASGDKFVVMEYLYKDYLMVGKHFEKNDEDQTIRKPDFHTSAEDAKDTDKYIYNNGDQIVRDVFKYEDLTPGVEVVVDTYLVDLEGNELKDAEGNRISVETVFTPEKTSGEIVIEIPVNGKFFEGQALTVFEDVYEKDVLIGVHHDLTQENQTVYVPEIKTTASFSENKEAEEFTLTLTDVLEYKNFEVGQTYVTEARLMDPETQKVFVDEEGKEYIAEQEFTPTETSGTVEVKMDVPARLIEGKTYVFFEKAYRTSINEETEEVVKAEEPFAEHEDWEDKNQTLHIPSIRTKAELATTFIDEALNKIKIKDTISFTNLTVGEEYMFVGTLMDRETGEGLKDSEGNVITANAKIRPEEANGTVEVVFVAPADDLVGREVVVFEDAYVNYELETQERVAIHRDLEDKDQTVDVPMELIVQISKADAGNVKYFIKGAEITIFNEDGTIAKDKNGKDCVGITDKNGEVKFHVLYGKHNSYYAQETKAPAGYHINLNKFEVKPTKDAKYKANIDIQILDQAIIIPPVKTGDDNNMAVWITMLAIAAAGVTGLLVIKKRRSVK